MSGIDKEIHADFVVIGSGPGGYTSAFRAADLGKKVVLVERYPDLGGVCLNVGCIPSKTLLHAAKVVEDAKEMSERGIVFAPPTIEPNRLAAWKNQVVGKLTAGLASLANRRKVTVVQGTGTFVDHNSLKVDGPEGETAVTFDHAVIATGSRPMRIPGVPHDDPRVMDSTDALELNDIPERMLVVGGGVIGLEMACVYHELGTKITVVEWSDGLMPGADPDIIKPYFKHVDSRYENIYLGTRVSGMDARESAIHVRFEGADAPAEDSFDKVLIAIGRRANGDKVGAENAGVFVDGRGFIPVDSQQRTNVPHIFAIGDLVGPPMLAHKAVHEGRVAAEVASGLNSHFDARVIPAVAYTDPEVAWAGMTETQAKEENIDFGKGVFPWAASGRSLSLGRDEGLTKVLFDKADGRLIGVGIVGPNAGDLIAEAALAIEMGCDAHDLSLTVHPHPTLSETVPLAAEVFDGTVTDL